MLYLSFAKTSGVKSSSEAKTFATGASINLKFLGISVGPLGDELVTVITLFAGLGSDLAFNGESDSFVTISIDVDNLELFMDPLKNVARDLVPSVIDRSC